MNTQALNKVPWLNGHNLFKAFKYTIYCLLSYNLLLFYLEESKAALQAYPNGLPLSSIIEAYSATIDTASWVIMLWIFELETAVVSDSRLKGWLGWVFTALKTICYGFIAYAFYGYILKYFFATDIEASNIQDACSLIGQGWSVIDSLNDYFPLSESNCGQLAQGEIFNIAGTKIIGNQQHIDLIHNLALVDVINAGAWVIVVALLQTEVVLQLHNMLSDRILKIAKYIKAVLYSILFIAAVYWGIDGKFLDFWDAFLWLLAFVLIDLNILNWHEEIQEEQEELNKELQQGASQ